MNDSIASANSLKGLAILVVMANHYALNFISKAFGGYANTAIAIFFLLSGYGLYRSRACASTFLPFIRKRVIRLYPLFLLASLATLAFIPSFTLDQFGMQVVLLHGFVQFWFVPAIVQCYLLFLPACRAMERFGLLPAAAFAAACVLASYLLLHNHVSVVIRNANYYHLFYRQIILYHGVIFILGMVFARLEDRPGFTPPLGRVFASMPAVTGIILALLALQGLAGSFAGPTGVMLARNGVPAAISLVAGLAVLNRARSRILAFVGGISYEIYLFHLLFYTGIGALLRRTPGKGHLIVYTVAAVALIVLTSLALHKADGALQKRLRKAIC